jgi:hypothetical protein
MNTKERFLTVKTREKDKNNEWIEPELTVPGGVASCM